jgi:Ca2+:H+ antiporter
MSEHEGADGISGANRPSDSLAWISAGLLIAALTSVVLLAKLLSHPLDDAVASAGLPQAVVGVAIAVIVLLPESTAAIRSAAANRLQTSINLALGSAIASIGLTIPTVAAIAVIYGLDLVLGLSPAHQTLLILTLFVSTITLGTGRTTVLQGGVHLVLLAVFLLLSAVP